MPNIHNEETFESNIVASLLKNSGYIERDKEKYDAGLGIDSEIFFAFIKNTQPKKWEQLKEYHQERVFENVLNRLDKELDKQGILKCLRKGITNYGVDIDLIYFKPESTLNPDSKSLYNQNILSVMRQVHYNTKKTDQSVDLVLFINGLPVATAELKNPFTGQNFSNAEKQLAYTRNPKEKLFQFKKRALVHFAVDPNEVSMTTQIKGDDTYFLPFNKGSNNGAGNPDNPNGYKTAYLWEEVWAKDSWLDIIQKFIHLEKKEIKVDGKILEKETMIFPRFHQLDVVRKLTYDTRDHGVGKNYLIQHSAGSGKSNSIAWLAYRLSSLHDKNNQAIFDSVIVLTDRVVLDKQLQDTIYQFEHKQGVVQRIEKDSNQLADAIRDRKRIIITTVQKFPFILERIGEFKSSNYAVIIDEAHSSQGGETSKKMKEVLSAQTLEEAMDEEQDNDRTFEDVIRESMNARGKQENLSFYAFTATPKAKTLEVFGVPSPVDNKPIPFHLYSMRQAIEEGFILDVLKNYVTYKTYFRITKQIQDDPELDKKKANRAIARFLSLHPHNLSQKTEIIVEHFKNVTMKKIGGKAKAMVVTSSRLHAYHYWLEFNKYIREQGYQNEIRILVAFSGGLTDPDTGEKVTEPQLNNMKLKELPEKFSTDEYKILLVADKYQTGYDEPQLHTMFVDKKLHGVRAVQTLSRLNRTHPGKEDTFVLDFANDVDSILDAFQPYYENTTIDEKTDPNHLYDLKNELEDYQVFWRSEVDNFANIFFSPYQTKSDQQKLYVFVNPAVDRYRALEKEVQETFKKQLTAFIRTYAFLGQVMPFQDEDLEKLYAYARLLRNALPKKVTERFDLNDEIALQYYKLQKVQEGQIELEKQGVVELHSMKDAGSNSYDAEEKSALSEIIEMFNDRLGTEFTEADQLTLESLKARLNENDTLVNQAKVNSKENFKYVFNDAFDDLLIEHLDRNEELIMQILQDDKLKKKVSRLLINDLFKTLEAEDIEKLIRKGESQNLEFKSSLRWDVRQNQVNKDLEKVIMKTIAGYMNADGGQLIIGVEDNGNIFGLENDYEALKNGDSDKFENHITQLVKSAIGADSVRNFHIIFDNIQGKDVCLITVLKSNKPVYVTYKGKEEFFVRTGNNTSSLSMKETQDYIEGHW